MAKSKSTANLDYQSLELRFSQLQRVADRSRSSKYSDSAKKKFHDDIVKVVEAISQQDFAKCSQEQLSNTQIVVERLFKWFEFLVNSTINQTPYEIISCLEEVLNDWLDDRKDFLLLTSLSNNKDLFAFEYDRHPGVLKQAKNCIESEYGIKIEFDVIRIILPRFFSHDYLTAVSLYHEIAHFIDWRYRITDEILETRGLSARSDVASIRSAYQEYFADLFAAQYVELSSCRHINYLSNGRPTSTNHPPVAKRIAMVERFLAGKAPIGDMREKYIDIKNAVKKITGRDLKKRFKEVPKTDFNNLIPVNIKQTSELHGLFVMAWRIWLDPKSKLRKQFSNRYDLYRILNNLVEKSISNYFLTKSWTNVPH